MTIGPGFSREQVLELAPDVAAAKAGQGQAVRTKWKSLGQDERALWGECQGSGASPYRCSVARDDTAARCSCPSRKLPCKHALGLLLLFAGEQVQKATCPDWVTEWLTARAERQARQERQASTAERKDEPREPDLEAQQRRAASRDKKVDAGVDELRRWLADLARGGLAAAQAQPWQWWDQVARRMIDAQARGLANRVRRLAEIAAAGGQRPDWPERMLDELGGLHLLCEAWTRRDNLPPATLSALRARIGYTMTAAEVIREGRPVTDTWAVLGHKVDEEGQLRSLRQWLYGERTGEVVSYLAFAVTGQPLEPGLPPGGRSEATVVAYPGTLPPRVLIAERLSAGATRLGRLPGYGSWDDAFGAGARVLAVDPWAQVLPVAVNSVTVLPGTTGSPWLLRDRTERAVPVAAPPEVCWRLLAVSGGGQADVAGEWDGFAFSPQAAAAAGSHGQLIA